MGDQRILIPQILDDLVKFIVYAKKNSYAANAKESDSLYDGLKDIEIDGNKYRYLDSYSGFYRFSGREIIWRKDLTKPVFVMNYFGGMTPENWIKDNKEEFAKQTYAFIKKALIKIEEEKPFRGPKKFSETGSPYIYSCNVNGHLNEFSGRELVNYYGKRCYELEFFGGFLIHKD